MKFLELLEKAWIAAAVVALVVTVYNAATVQAFNHKVYFPLLCAMFCGLLWYNVRGQRRFRQRVEEQEMIKKQDNKKTDNS